MNDMVRTDLYRTSDSFETIPSTSKRRHSGSIARSIKMVCEMLLRLRLVESVASVLRSPSAMASNLILTEPKSIVLIYHPDETFS